MSAARPRASEPSHGVPPTRLAAGLVLFLLVVVSASAREQVPARPPGHLPSIGLLLAISLLAMAMLAVLLIAGVLLPRGRKRRRRASDLPHPLAKAPQGAPFAFATVLAVMIAVVALTLVVARQVVTRPEQPAASTRSVSASHHRSVPAAQSPATSHAADVTSAQLAIAAVVFLCAAGAAAAVIRQRTRRRGPKDRPGRDAPQRRHAVPDAESVSRLLRHGAAAMSGVDDPRDAIITCYAAMERDLAAAGVGRDAAQTPSELLRAAVVAGAVARRPATALTRLFELARFSGMPMTTGHRRQAQDALSELEAGIHP